MASMLGRGQSRILGNGPTIVTSPIAFVEDKPAYGDEVRAYLTESAAANRWTNFGPVWQRLRAHIEAALGLAPDRCAIPTSSGTHALVAAAALAARRGVRRWIVSSYGFRATLVGPFAGADVVDCDEEGLIDLAAVKKRKPGPDTGIIITNPFGVCADINEAIGFARQAGAVVVIDNAAAFADFDRTGQSDTFECLSFHHTKPFGFGEGGCLILDRELGEDATAAVDFGYRGAWPVGREALSNGKLSDPAAAFILARQRDSGRWMPTYREQFRRILGIGEQLGFRPLVGRHRIGDGAYPSVPLVWPDTVPDRALENDTIVLRKYYKPLGDGAVSCDLYRRIVNVPCHPGVALVSDDSFARLLDEVGRKSRRRHR